MSRTQIKHYRAVWEGSCAVGLAKEGIWHGLVTVGEVMRQTQLSRPTVLKYLNQGVNDGYFEKWGGAERQAGLYRLLITE